MNILEKHFFPSNEGYLITHGMTHLSFWVWYEDTAGDRKLIKKFRQMNQAREYVTEKVRTCGTCEN